MFFAAFEAIQIIGKFKLSAVSADIYTVKSIYKKPFYFSNVRSIIS
jgi:hypothetical protein